MSVPANPKIYHIVHVDRLESILDCGGLLSDAQIVADGAPGTTIGMGSIKKRRLESITLDSHPGLYVGQCVPFYFCPRSVMLYLLYRANHPELTYRGGQGPIVHLEADLRRAVRWAEKHKKRWAFTSSNAGSYFFDDYADLDRLDEIDWDAVGSLQWAGEHREGKQAEFLIEDGFPWSLVERIGTSSERVYRQVENLLPRDGSYRPRVEVMADWYYP